MTGHHVLGLLLAGGLLLAAAGSALAGGPSLHDLGNGICQDQDHGFMWQIIPSKKKFTDADDAAAYLDTLNLGGYHDWRLPTEAELTDLLSLISIQGNDDCRFPRLDKAFWLRDSHGKTLPARLEMECFCRGDFDLVKRNKGQVRAVRTIKKTVRTKE